jgi:hypothetical protein
MAPFHHRLGLRRSYGTFTGLGLFFHYHQMNDWMNDDGVYIHLPD